VYANKIAAITDPAERERFVSARIAEQAADFTLLRMGSEMVVDTIVEPVALRAEIIARLDAAANWQRSSLRRHHVVSPV
jgi:acetyl-CoA carboxylase carboxyltransferase component